MALEFHLGVEHTIADQLISNYRGIPLNGINGVYYEHQSMLDYLNNALAYIIKNQPARPEGYRWAIGFHHALRNNQLITLIAPVLVNNHPPQGMPEVLDCFTSPNYFDKTITHPVTQNPYFIFDEGHLWP